MEKWAFSLLKILTFKIEGLWRNPGGKNELQPLLYTFHRAYQINFGQNTDGLEILDSHLFYRLLTKEKMAHGDRSSRCSWRRYNR